MGVRVKLCRVQADQLLANTMQQMLQTSTNVRMASVIRARAPIRQAHSRVPVTLVTSDQRVCQVILAYFEQWLDETDSDTSNNLLPSHGSNMVVHVHGSNMVVHVHVYLDMDTCASSPCYGDATCVNYPAVFQCICPLGSTGTLCDQGKEYESKANGKE
jgi:uncharacterized Rossmann fold enzyme